MYSLKRLYEAESFWEVHAEVTFDNNLTIEVEEIFKEDNYRCTIQ